MDRLLIKRRASLGGIVAPAILLLLTFLFITEVILSWQWRMVHDTPLLHYVAFLMDRYHYVPYRDVFETSMPGSFLFHLAIGKLFGYGDLAFRWVDLIWSGALLAVTWAIMQRFGRRVAWASIILFGLSYLQYGPQISLQRDHVAVLPISLALLLAISPLSLPPAVQALLVGFLFGLSATIKPHLTIGLPLILLFQWRQFQPETARLPSALRFGLSALIGLLLPIIGVLGWLWHQGALPFFREMVSSYLPLHLGLTKTHQTIFGAERWAYLIASHRNLGGRSLWLIPACLGGYLAVFETRFSKDRVRAVYLLAALTLLYSLYPVLAGQFFLYHWMPFQYFVVIFAGLVLVPLPDPPVSRLQPIMPLAALGLALYLGLHLPPDFSRQIQGLSPLPPKAGRVDQIADFLRSHLQPGDRVQPLDWTGGAVHAMLLSEAQVATPFIYDYHFYHHISNPYIQTLRRRFIEGLNQVRPRFIVEINDTDKPWISGPDTAREFKELAEFLNGSYTPSLIGNGFTIYQRR